MFGGRFTAGCSPGLSLTAVGGWIAPIRVFSQKQQQSHQAKLDIIRSSDFIFPVFFFFFINTRRGGGATGRNPPYSKQRAHAHDSVVYRTFGPCRWLPYRSKNTEYLGCCVSAWCPVASRSSSILVWGSVEPPAHWREAKRCSFFFALLHYQFP